MSFISYAQNFEDVLLRRAFRHIEQGFYIDVGANDPSADSITRAFYDLGWHGINIEPLKSHYDDLVRDRARDINLQCAAGDRSGRLQLWETDTRGWATADPQVVSQHQAQGHIGQWHQVPVKTLCEICKEYAQDPIHFLKIDVEGYESEVIQGANWSLFRPWVVLVEAMWPNSSEPTHASWESILLNHAYAFVYSDGINRFYLASEHLELAHHFAYPPNAFDDFIPSEQQRYKEHTAALETQLNETRTDLNQQIECAQNLQTQLNMLNTQLHALNTQLSCIHAELNGVYTSTSWRITRPLRWIGVPIRRIRQVITNRHDDLSRRFLYFLVSRPIWRSSALWWLHFLKLNVPMQENLQWQQKPEPGHWLRYPVRSLPAYTRSTSPRIPESSCLPEHPQPSRWVRLTGHLQGHYSLALVNRELTKAFAELTANRVSAVIYDGQRTSDTATFSESRDRKLNHLTATQIPSSKANQTLSVVHHYPLIQDTAAAGMFGALFFWEETAVPQETIDTLNKYYDLIWVATQTVKDALINSGCIPPVFVIRIGVDHILSSSTPTPTTLKPAQKRRYLHISSAFDRKGVDVLLNAYLEVFGDSETVELYIKTFANPHHSLKETITQQRLEDHRMNSVIVDESPLSRSELIALYESADAMILPSRGEGFNLPAAEAMALGIPVLTTAHTGHNDFCTSDTAIVVETHYARSKSHLACSDSCWLEPNLSDLIQQWKHLDARLDSDDLTLTAMTQAARAYVHRTFQWRSAAIDIFKTTHWLQTQQLSDAHALSVSVVTPWASPCGIAEYSKSQMLKLMDDPKIHLTIYCDERTRNEADDVNICWRVGDTNSVLDALESIKTDLPDVLLIQHQPSLFQLSVYVCEQLASIRSNGTVVLLELHSTQQVLVENIAEPAMARALRQLDRIIVHSPNALNDLFELGVSTNAMLMPLGMIDPPASMSPNITRAALSIPDNAIVLGTFGFLMPHKGIDTLILSLDSLEASLNRPVHLIAVTAARDPAGQNLIKEYRKLVRDKSLEPRVHWITDYLPITESQQWLQLTDYLVFPYKGTREGASAAVTVGLSTRTPVLVSPLEIFADVKEVTHALTDHSVDAVVSAVVDLVQRPAEHNSSCVENKKQWFDDRDWAVLSARLLNMMRALRCQRQLDAAVHKGRQTHAAWWSTMRPRQLLVDISELHQRDARTGIQRVVRAVLKALQDNPPKGFRVTPVYADENANYHYASQFITDTLTAPNAETPMDAAAGDVFLGLDLTAHLFPRIEPDLAALRDAGVKIYYVVYDLIPVRYPHYAPEGMSPVFTHWLTSISHHADGLICISLSVAYDLLRWQVSELPNTPLPVIRSFSLGSDLEASQPTTGLPHEANEVLLCLRARSSFLMVGTLEPRKGHGMILDAFETLWAEGHDINLVIAGKRGWQIDELETRIKQHPELTHRLFWLDSPSDEFLINLYQQAHCLIAASETEGFGLPLVEAAKYKLPIIASDIDVFREIADRSAYYVKSHNSDAFARSISHWLDLYAKNKHPKTEHFQFMSWKQSAQELLKAINLSH